MVPRSGNGSVVALASWWGMGRGDTDAADVIQILVLCLLSTVSVDNRLLLEVSLSIRTPSVWDSAMRNDGVQ